MAATGNEVPLLSQLKQLKDWVAGQISKKLDDPVGGSPQDGDVVSYQSIVGSANPTHTVWVKPSSLVPLATSGQNGLMSSSDKSKLDGIDTGRLMSPQQEAKLDSLSVSNGILALSSGGTGADNKTDARHGIGIMDLLWTGSVEISGNTIPSPLSITGISNYHVIVVSFSGRSAPCVLSRFAGSNWFYGDSSYTAGNAAQTIYSLGICINSTGDPDAVTELRCCSHVVSADGSVGKGNFGATINRVYGVA